MFDLNEIIEMTNTSGFVLENTILQMSRCQSMGQLEPNIFHFSVLKCIRILDRVEQNGYSYNHLQKIVYFMSANQYLLIFDKHS